MAIPPSPNQRSMFFGAAVIFATIAQHPVFRRRLGSIRWASPRRERAIMPVAVIVDAVRTPGGKRNGKLKNWHPADLASEVLSAIASRNQLDPALVDDVI